ncbi:hypothetical protein NHQ30_002986 [Ciborinia camelliae]|nr:hypothetical protein NHQ30_002986 [Ciborinia camelliae]
MSPLEQTASSHREHDVEKGTDTSAMPSPSTHTPLALSPSKSPTHPVTIPASLPSKNRFFSLTTRIENYFGLEARGIHRVLPAEQTTKTTLSFLQIVVLWFSINTAPQNITLASIGASVYGLGFLDATLCSVFGAIVGVLPVAYVAGWGPWSGNRTLICARFTMGWWPVKLCVILNLVILLGYSMIDAVVAGQMLSAVSPNGSLSVEVGIIVSAVLTFTVTTFGIKVFHHYERFAWIPQTSVLLILAGTAGPKFDLSSKSTVEGATLAGNRLSFFSICLSAAQNVSTRANSFLTSRARCRERHRYLRHALPSTHTPLALSPSKSPTHPVTIPASLPSKNRFFSLTTRIENYFGLEARGIHRVLPAEQTTKTTLSFLQIVVLWFSINTAPQNITLASIGASVYGLGFLDATLCSVFGAIVGVLPVAYVAGWGPWSGNRTLICARFTMGWWPVKLCVILNLVILLGYSMIDAVVAGQMLSAVSPNGSLSVEVGIIVSAVLTFTVTTFGIKVFHHYERFAWIPQTSVLLILAGTAGPKFDLSSKSTVEGATLAGNRLSFFSICLSAAVTYAPIAADFFVYCDPKIVSRWKIFAATLLGLSLSFTFTFIIGTGLASGLANTPSWEAAGAGSGALIVAGFESLGGFGKFCSVIAALGLIANMVPPTYSCGIDFQILGRYPAMVPRFLWNTFAVVVFTVCALAGRNDLSEIFTNFLSLMGYWVVLWIVITLEEEFLFRRRKSPTFVWSDWNKQDKMPLGIAAFAAFCVGWVGAILCMSQYYFIGPLAKMIGSEGGDMGNYVGFAWAGIVYPGLRWWEVRRFGR